MALIAVGAISCSSARPIEPPRTDQLNGSTSKATDEQSHLSLSARVLDEEQSNALFHVSAVERDALPVLFAVTNGGSAPLSVRQDDFRLRVDGRRIAPALPGRAASLLRDNSGSTGAMWAGYLVFGALAAPALHDAEKNEEAAMRASRETIFTGAEISPGNTVGGYLVFELPVPVAEIGDPVLEMHQRSAAPLEISLGNPYARTN